MKRLLVLILILGLAAPAYAGCCSVVVRTAPRKIVLLSANAGTGVLPLLGHPAFTVMVRSWPGGSGGKGGCYQNHYHSNPSYPYQAVGGVAVSRATIATKGHNYNWVPGSSSTPGTSSTSSYGTGGYASYNSFVYFYQVYGTWQQTVNSGAGSGGGGGGYSGCHDHYGDGGDGNGTTAGTSGATYNSSHAITGYYGPGQAGTAGTASGAASLTTSGFAGTYSLGVQYAVRMVVWIGMTPDETGTETR